jgi:hypothetical protein
MLPKKDKQNIFTLLNKNMNISDFPVDTHIGYRGPIIFWKEIKELKKVYIL